MFSLVICTTTKIENILPESVHGQVWDTHGSVFAESAFLFGQVVGLVVPRGVPIIWVTATLRPPPPILGPERHLPVQFREPLHFKLYLQTFSMVFKQVWSLKLAKLVTALLDILIIFCEKVLINSRPPSRACQSRFLLHIWQERSGTEENQENVEQT